MRWSYRILRIAGTDVKVHVTFLLLLLLYWVLDYQAGGVEAAVATLLLILAVFLCVTLHEFGHIFMARRFGVRTPDVILLPIGGVARLERMPDEPRQEFLIALAGPAVTLVIALALYGWVRLQGEHPPLVAWNIETSSLTVALMHVNVFLLLFNLIPAFPMDGGRVFRSLLASRMGLPRATRVAASLGQLLAFVFGFIGFTQNLFMLVLIAFFIFLGAGAELQAVEARSAGAGIRVRDVMMTRFRTVPVHARLSEVVRMLLEGDQKEFPVVDNDGRVEGVLTRDQLIKGLSQRGLESTVQESMLPRPTPLAPDQSFENAVAQLRASGVSALPVLDPGGALVGMVSQENVAELILVRRAVGR